MIGIFDSGIGGLTVAREIMKRLPELSLLYLGDTARTPYGNKSAEVVAAYGLQAAKFLVDRGARIIVVACNTVSALGLEAIKEAYPKVPVFDVITPAAAAIVGSQKPEAKSQKPCRIGVMGTRALVGSGIYQHLLSQQNNFQVTAQAAPLLVPLVEEGWLDRPETKRIIKRYLTPFRQAQVETLVLACTHYPLLKTLIAARLSRQVKVIDPAEETAETLFNWLAEHPAEAANFPKGESHWCVTDFTPQTEIIASRWLRRTIKLEKVTLQ